MKKFFKKYWFLILILTVAAFLRFYKLGAYPALNADEASNGYDAYSLIQTGKDQHGHSWPLTFESFNDYKPGLYVYLDIPFIKFLGLNIWAVRLPGALAGVLSVLVLYLLVKELKIGNSLKIGKWKLEIAEIAALFLAISPWHIQFSRGGWEVNISTFFILLGFYLLLIFIRLPKFRYLIFAVFSLALSLYSYHAARVIVPLLGLVFILIYKKAIFVKENGKKIVIAGVVGVIILLPLTFDLLKPGSLSRASGVGLFADQGPLNRVNEQRGEHGDPTVFLAKAIHNKAVNYGLKFLSNFTSHFNGEFLFMSGDSIERNKVPETGEMYLFDIPLLLFGFIFIARTFAQNSKAHKFILSWLIIAPIASSLTFQSPNALRSQNMVVPLVVISALGFLYLATVFKNFRKWGTIAVSLVIIFMLWNFGRYVEMYYSYMSKIYPYSSQYGVKEMVSYLSENEPKYNDVFITTRYDQPYILFLFYTKYPPDKFQSHHTLSSRDAFGFSTVNDFGKYHFEGIDYDSIKNNYPNSLIIGTPKEIPQAANIIKRIYGTNNFEYFDIVSN